MLKRNQQKNKPIKLIRYRINYNKKMLTNNKKIKLKVTKMNKIVSCQ